MPPVAREYEGEWRKFSSRMSIILRARLGGVFALSYKTVKHKALASLQHIASDLDMTREDRKHLAFRPATLRLKVPQSCPFLLGSVAACVPLSPFILISNTRARLHHAFWLSSPMTAVTPPQSNGAPVSSQVKHGNIKFRDLDNKMLLWQRCPGNLPLAQTWKLLLERILHLIARINSDHNYQHQWIVARFNTLSLGLLSHWAESRKHFSSITWRTCNMSKIIKWWISIFQ